ncbi:unnamed protein product, partial [Musa acuminata subsp. burmannicoides]
VLLIHPQSLSSDHTQVLYIKKIPPKTSAKRNTTLSRKAQHISHGNNTTKPIPNTEVGSALIIN